MKSNYGVARWGSLLLALCLLFQFSACSSNSGEPPVDEDVGNDSNDQVGEADIAVEQDLNDETSVDGEPDDLVADEAGGDEIDIEPDTEPDTEPDIGTDIDIDPYAFCDAQTDTNCLLLTRGESSFYQKIDRFDTMQYDDKGTTRTVVRLSDLIEPGIAEDPAAWRYKMFGLDEFTFGGYATWDNMLLGYIEVGTRRVVWDPVLELPDSWRVKDTYRMELTPAGAGK